MWVVSSTDYKEKHTRSLASLRASSTPCALVTALKTSYSCTLSLSLVIASPPAAISTAAAAAATTTTTNVDAKKKGSNLGGA